MILSLLELVSERYIAYSSRFVGEFSSWTMDAVQLRTNKSDVFKKTGLGAWGLAEILSTWATHPQKFGINRDFVCSPFGQQPPLQLLHFKQ